jgi:hypothetical protein
MGWMGNKPLQFDYIHPCGGVGGGGGGGGVFWEGTIDVGRRGIRRGCLADVFHVFSHQLLSLPFIISLNSYCPSFKHEKMKKKTHQIII